MRISKTFISIALVLLIGGSISVLAKTDQTISRKDQKRLDDQNIYAITSEQHTQMDQEMVLKAEFLSTYAPTQAPLNPYLIDIA